MSAPSPLRSTRLLKNTGLNLIGQIIPGVVALVATPVLIHGLGLERFGVLSLIWVLQTYFGLFDFGLGRAVTKHVAEALGRRESDRVRSIVWTSLALITVLGLVGSFTFFLLTPVLVKQLFHVSADMVSETERIFRIISISVPVLLISGTLSGVLEAYQRFDLVNLVKAPSISLTFLILATAVVFGAGLPAMVLLLLIKDFVFVGAYLMLCIRLLPKGPPVSLNFKEVPRLLYFGGWMTAIFISAWLASYLDRLMIGARLSMADLAYYAPPYDFVSKLLIVPASLYLTLFPAFSAIGREQRATIEVLYVRASKYLFLVSGLLTLVLLMFADEILRLWLGREFAQHSSQVFRILVVGFFLNAQAWIPSTLLQGIGRPDLVAKIFLSELPFYIGILWWLIGGRGIEGAALAWAVRGGVEAVLFHWTAWRIGRYRAAAFLRNGAATGIVMLWVATAAWFTVDRVFQKSWEVEYLLFSGMLVLFGWIAWRRVLDWNERSALLKYFKPDPNPRVE